MVDKFLLVLLIVASTQTVNLLHINTTTNTDYYAKVILINDTRNSPVNEIDSNGNWYLQCISNGERPTFWGLIIELKSSFYGFRENKNTTIEITINDMTRNGELDLFTAFSVNDKYFANLNNADKHVRVEPSRAFGQFIYPSNLSTIIRPKSNQYNLSSNECFKETESISASS